MRLIDPPLARLSAELGAALEAAGLRVVTAESCTGGWVAQVITHTAGSSAWFERGFVTYSNEAKQEQLGVSAELIRREGAVSRSVAAAMAEGALRHARAHLSVAVSGIAGPTGGSPEKPLGTVCFALCWQGEAPRTYRRRFGGDREMVRYQALCFALEEMLAQVRARTMPFMP